MWTVLFNNNCYHKPEEKEEVESEEETMAIELPNIKGLKVCLGYSSKEFAFLTEARERGSRGFRSIKKITLKIQDLKTNTHDTSNDLLEKISNSLFLILI
ncbi:hypothetical protein [Dysgonomonas sp. Marseille-P4361]|uniref:hypothetical protein n=1 Tax=Dysgonomonas sp. Marseille-P4361 TaxID=2161820 RepID=UPI000D55FBF4|nr:hypothetical protein [Dysgonomonas sp. Marseille-P4361]